MLQIKICFLASGSFLSQKENILIFLFHWFLIIWLWNNRTLTEVISLHITLHFSVFCRELILLCFLKLTWKFESKPPRRRKEQPKCFYCFPYFVRLYFYWSNINFHQYWMTDIHAKAILLYAPCPR